MQAGWVNILGGHTLELFQRERAGRYLILDNQHPTSGGRTMGVSSVESLMDTAIKMKADEVIIPDVLNDAQATLNSFSMFFLRQQHLYYDGGLMFVPQGRNLVEWMSCYDKFIQTGYSHLVRTIGIPKWLGEDRFKALDYIIHPFMIHFLGVESGWKELERVERVRSWDTSLMYAFSQRNLVMRDMPGVMKIQLEDGMDANPTVLRNNIRFAKALLMEERVRDDS